ncbi:hypothetical protein Tco_0945411 [Tanacetum coccineum]
MVESYNSYKDIITSYGDVVLLKKGRDDQDKDEDPSAGSDRGTKRRKSEDPSHTVEDSGMQQDQKFVTGDDDKQPADKEVNKADWFKKPERPPTIDPDWNLEYLKGGDLSRRYLTSVTKTNAATYELKWIKDLVHELQEKGSGYGSGYRQAALSEEVDAESRDVRWWKDIRERSQASGKDNMTSSYSVSTYFSNENMPNYYVDPHEDSEDIYKDGRDEHWLQYELRDS